MILSNSAIVKAIEQLRLSIVPEIELTPKVSPFNTSSIDLRLGNKISRPKERPFIIDLRRGKFDNIFNAENYQMIPITKDTPFTLRQHDFVLARTLEEISLPIIHGYPALAARVEGRSRWSRVGLLVHATAPTIHAGFYGPITLEICNLGPHDIALYPEAYICQLIVEEVQDRPVLSESQFRGQTGPQGR